MVPVHLSPLIHTLTYRPLPAYAPSYGTRLMLAPVRPCVAHKFLTQLGIVFGGSLNCALIARLPFECTRLLVALDGVLLMCDNDRCVSSTVCKLCDACAIWLYYTTILLLNDVHTEHQLYRGEELTVVICDVSKSNVTFTFKTLPTTPTRLRIPKELLKRRERH
jgi:hypothetical protein